MSSFGKAYDPLCTEISWANLRYFSKTSKFGTWFPYFSDFRPNNWEIDLRQSWKPPVFFLVISCELFFINRWNRCASKFRALEQGLTAPHHLYGPGLKQKREFGKKASGKVGKSDKPPVFFRPEVVKHIFLIKWKRCASKFRALEQGLTAPHHLNGPGLKQKR